MTNPRIRRLKLDQERLESRFWEWPPIRISGCAGLPPEQYQVIYRIKGLYTAADGRILERHEHVAEISLSLGYPRRAPQCKMLTPIFHPNFDGSTICIGDFWAASEGLDDLVVRIGRMIAYQEYNVKSPLNGLAARWAAQNAQLLPVDRREIAPPLSQQISEDAEKVTITLPADIQATSKPSLPTAYLAFESARHLLLDEVTTIGRGEDNTICISDASVSEHHAQIFRTPEGFILRTVDSANETWIGNIKIDGDAFLADGDAIRFGSISSRLEC
jgi:ubiquitin-protein ligase